MQKSVGAMCRNGAPVVVDSTTTVMHSAGEALVDLCAWRQSAAGHPERFTIKARDRGNRPAPSVAHAKWPRETPGGSLRHGQGPRESPGGSPLNRGRRKETPRV